jgi:hypothetical protein
MTDNLRAKLEPGDLVLVEHYFTGDSEKGYPGRMVLGEVKGDWGHSISARKVVILYPLQDGDNPLFEVRRNYSGSEYVLRGTGTGVDIMIDEFFHPMHFGRKAVLERLDKTPQYKPYADVLRATDPVLVAEKIEKDLAFVIEDAIEVDR